MAIFIIEDMNKFKFFRKFVSFYLWINPFFIFILIWNAIKKTEDSGSGLRYLALITGSMNTIIVLIVLYSGIIFRNILSKHFDGRYIRNVQWSVVIICVCYLTRACYDFIKSFFYESFEQMREESQKENKLYYGIFFLLMLLCVEFLPLVLFNFNIKFLASNKLALSPRPSKMKKDR